MNPYKQDCYEENAQKFWSWIKTRGGVAVWHSVNLSNPGVSWSTPKLQENGEPSTPPTWQSGNEPKVITDPELIEVFTSTEHKRFHVAIQRGGSFNFKCTDASSKKIRREVEKAGEGAYYEFDYSVQEAVIMKSKSLGNLKEYAESHGW